MTVKLRADLLTALQCTLSLSPDLDLEFKTFSIFPRQTQLAAPGGGTWPAGPATSHQPRSSSVCRIQVQVSRSPPRSVSDHRLSFGQKQVLLRQNTAPWPQWPHCTGRSSLGPRTGRCIILTSLTVSKWKII